MRREPAVPSIFVAEFFRSPRLGFTELRQIDVHCRYRARLGEYGEVDLDARLHMKIVNHIGTIFHPSAIAAVG